MRELLVANPDKPQAGGTFTDLYIGEALTIPSNWGSLQGLGRRLVGAGARTKQTAFGLGQSPGRKRGRRDDARHRRPGDRPRGR